MHSIEHTKKARDILHIHNAVLLQLKFTQRDCSLLHAT